MSVTISADHLYLLDMHTSGRREKIVAAFEAIRFLGADDLKFVLDARREKFLDQVKLGTFIGKYYRELEACYLSQSQYATEKNENAPVERKQRVRRVRAIK